MKYAISASYNASFLIYVNFPEGKTWADVSSWYVRWNTLHVQFEVGKDYIWLDLETNDSPDVDRETPNRVTVHPTNEKGEVDYDEELAES